MQTRHPAHLLIFSLFVLCCGFLSTSQAATPIANSVSYSITSGYSLGFTLRGKAINYGSSPSFRVISAPTQGTLTGSAPNIIYRPNKGFIGEDSLTFVINDGIEDSAEATVNLTVLTALDDQSLQSTQIVAGGGHSVLLQPDGTLLLWGSNIDGQLGNGTDQDQLFFSQLLDANGNPVTQIESISTGRDHTLALLSNGTLLAWGRNDFGQLGDGSHLEDTIPDNKLIPTAVVDATGNTLTEIAAISSGRYHSVALKTDGTLLSWGNNDDGQLGTDGDSHRSTPQTVVDAEGALIKDIIAISSGRYFTLALKSDGSLLAWGGNTYGQLGNGTTRDSDHVSPVLNANGTPLTGITAIFTGGHHSLALTTSGTLLAWGYNEFGQLGDGTIGTEEVTSPVTVLQSNGSPLTNIRTVTGGRYYTLATLNDGQLLGWGRNRYGQLGDGSVFDRPNPTSVVDTVNNPITNAITVSAGDYHTLTLTTDGRLLSWGRNRYGQLGNNQTDDHFREEPVRDTLGNAQTGIAKISGGGSHTLALKTDSSLIAWGRNNAGQLGDGTKNTRPSPVTVIDSNQQAITGIIAIDTGRDHSLALTSTGTVLAWGINSDGQLGIGNIFKRTRPTQVLSSNGQALSNIAMIASGRTHSLALTTDGRLFSWGNNSFGQLGNGNTDRQTTPVAVIDAQGQPLTNIKAIASGDYHVLALTDNNQLLTWGANFSDQLGLGAGLGETQVTPTLVLDNQGNPLSNIIAIAAGDSHSIVLQSNGQLLTWGRNVEGQLSYESSDAIALPTPVVDANGTVLTGITAIAAGAFHSLALTSTNTLLSWGSNINGQLGDGTLTSHASPTLVVDDQNIPLANIAFIASGDYHSFAITTNGQLGAWGRGEFGQLSSASHTQPFQPVEDNNRQALQLTFATDFDLTTHHHGTGTGTVIDNTNTIDCGSNCSGHYDNLTALSLTATPALGSEFIGWLGDCKGNTSCTLTMDKVHWVAAEFSLIPNEIPVASTGNYSVMSNFSVAIALSAKDADNQTLSYQITRNPTHGTLSGSAPNLTYTPDTGFTGSDSINFTAHDGLVSSATATISLTVLAIPVGSSLTVTKNGLGSGTLKDGSGNIDCGLTCQSAFNNAEQVSLIATPDPDSEFVSWSGNCSGSLSCVVNINQAAWVGAEFALIPNRPPVVTANGIQTTDEGSAVQFTGSFTDPDSHNTHQTTWTFGDGASSTSLTPQHTWVDNGTYLAKLTVIDNEGAISSREIQVTVNNVAPTTHAGTYAAIDEGQTFQFNGSQTDPGTLDTHDFLWDFGDGSHATTASVSHQYAAHGNYPVSLTVTDNDGGSTTDTTTVTVLDIPPVISTPTDITLNATGVVTFVDLGTASATDYTDGTLIATTNQNGLFTSGTHQITWEATDLTGNIATSTQHIHIQPQVNLAPNQIITEGGTGQFGFYLSGKAPTYPLIFNLSTDGSADNTDHNFTLNTLSLNTGTALLHSVNILNDAATNENFETLRLTLNSVTGATIGDQSEQTLALLEQTNLPPQARIDIKQNQQQTRFITRNGGFVFMTVSVTEQDGGDGSNISFDWSLSDNRLTDLDGVANNNSFLFIPASLTVASGTDSIYPIIVTITDAGSPTKQTQVSLDLKLLASYPTLMANQDQDHDGIPDTEEGYNDDDLDGIPNFQDGLPVNYALEGQINRYQNILTTEPGLSLELGTTAFIQETGAIVTHSVLANRADNPDGADASEHLNGDFDIKITHLPTPNQSYSVVLPQQQPLAGGGSMRLLRPNTGWDNFIEDSKNNLSSAPANQETCPPVKSTAYQAGLNAGDHCVKVRIQEGGVNDLDGISNTEIFFTGGIISSSVVIIPHDGDLAPLGNRDGRVTVADALVTLRYGLGLISPIPADDLAHGDVAPLDTNGNPNPDGRISVADALVVLRKGLGLIDF